ncbi:hypothetical protein [Actinoplanes sp. ATCC 53533]|uniref:hypothetical protein n=1 Tax=Actinoplanes sp. ATCC 53533 TaxID=1288362 RepID=UPI001315A001|nr:hypothetical protein [Actinoplanes sp. ATCC 53533]
MAVTGPGSRATGRSVVIAASRSGDFGPAGPALADLLGRPATTVEDYLLTSLPAGPGR